jgi:hypothetical protein
MKILAPEVRLSMPGPLLHFNIPSPFTIVALQAKKITKPLCVFVVPLQRRHRKILNYLLSHRLGDTGSVVVPKLFFLGSGHGFATNFSSGSRLKSGMLLK